MTLIYGVLSKFADDGCKIELWTESSIAKPPGKTSQWQTTLLFLQLNSEFQGCRIECHLFLPLHWPSSLSCAYGLRKSSSSSLNADIVEVWCWSVSYVKKTEDQHQPKASLLGMARTYSTENSWCMQYQYRLQMISHLRVKKNCRFKFPISVWDSFQLY